MLPHVAESALRRDRLIVAAGLVAIIALAWLYVLRLAASMAGAGMNGDMGTNMAPALSMPDLQPFQAGNLAFAFAMWVVMMIAMMTPSAAPMILLFAQLRRTREAERTPIPATLIFLAGYLVVWVAFSAGAAALQQGLQATALLSPDVMMVTPVLGGLFLLIAGVYQFTPLKRACLSHCRTPLGFLMNEWREGTRGTLVMGVRHGIYCVGCCWLLMTLLFVAGVMNVLWVALIAGFVLTEKVVRGGCGIRALRWDETPLFQPVTRYLVRTLES